MNHAELIKKKQVVSADEAHERREMDMMTEKRSEKGTFFAVLQPAAWLLGLLLILTVFSARPEKAFAAQEISLNLPVGSGGYISSPKKSDPFLLIMEEKDMFAGYHHAYTGPETSRDVYVKMYFAYTSEIWLRITLPMITRGDSFSAVSYDLLKGDRKTVVCTHRRSLVSYRATELNLFRGTLPAGTYYLRLHHYYDGDCYQATETNLTIEYFAAYSSLQEDDLKGSNNSKQTAAPMEDNQTGYISFLGDDPEDWYSFTVGQEGAKFYASAAGEGCLQAALYRENGETVVGKRAIYDSRIDSPLEVELKEGRYYAAVFYDELTGEKVLNKRGGAYSLWLTRNKAQTDPGQTETEADTKPEEKPSAAVSDGTRLFYNSAVYEVTGGGTAVICRNYTGAQTSVTIPASVNVNGVSYKVKSIAGSAFKNNKYLKTVKIGANVTSIGTEAFSGCTSLSTVSIGSKLTTIGTKAFYNCKALTKITIPAKVAKIGKSAFQGCKKLKTITVKTGKLTDKKVGSKAFTGTPSNAVVKVPKKSLKAYKKWLVKKGISKKAKIKS